MTDVKPAGLLWDSISPNIGDQAIGLVMRRFCETRGLPHEVLNPFSYEPSRYSTIIVGGGQLLRRKGDAFYDNFRVSGAHILNAVGMHQPDQLEYLQDYRLVTVRSEVERELLRPVIPGVRIRPCVSLVIDDLFAQSLARLPEDPSISADTIGIHVNMATFRALPDLLPALRELDRRHKLLLIPFTLYQNDVSIMQTLLKWLPGASINSARDPLAIFKSIGQLKILVCSSMHASIFAYVQNVPVLTYPTDPKIRSFWDERGYSSAVYNNTTELLYGIGRLLDDPLDYSSTLKRDKDQVNEHLDEIVSLVKSAPVSMPVQIIPGGHAVSASSASSYYDLILSFLSALGYDYASQIDLRMQLAEIQNSRIWRYALALRQLRVKFLPPGSRREFLARFIFRTLMALRNGAWGALKCLFGPASSRKFVPLPSDYKSWIQANEPNLKQLAGQRRAARRLPERPLISIVIPVYNTPEAVLKMAIQSVIGQTYDHWELCIANGSPAAQDICTILAHYSQEEPRIKVVQLDGNLGIAGNTNAAIRMAAGEFVAFLDHDDLLAPFALFEVVEVINENRRVDMLYSDEDKISADGRERFNPYFKPGFSPALLRSINYMPHFLVIRRRLGDEIDWIRDGFDGAQDYDLVLRAAEKAQAIAHIPRVLYHWRALPGSTALSLSSKEYATESGIKALRDHLYRQGLPGQAGQGYTPTTYRIAGSMTNSPLISIIVASRDRASNPEACIRSILEKSSYKNFEIIVAEDQSRQAAELLPDGELQNHPNVRVVRYDGRPSGLSALNNYAAGHASGDYLLFLNGNAEIINADWLENMLEHFTGAEVGVVGAKLYFPDDTLQHGGIIVGLAGPAGYIHRSAPRASSGYFGRLMLPHNLSAVTGACLMIKKEVFRGVLGFDPVFRMTLGDVDLCMKVRGRGDLVVWTPYAELYQHAPEGGDFDESKISRMRLAQDRRRFRWKWRRLLARGDEYYNPNFTLKHEDPAINPRRVEASARIQPGFVMNRPGRPKSG